ncbi:IS110 family transposase [Mycoplasmatota bacterium WC44]
MKYCITIDVAKGKSMVGLLSEEGEILIDFHEVLHNKSSLLKVHEKVNKLNLENLSVIMESTSTYHYSILKFFNDLNYTTILLNPIISKEHKFNLRKTKTDKTDCINLANIFFKEDFNKQSDIPNIYVELQHISRQIHNLSQNLVRYKNRFRQLVEFVFPEYETIFKNDALFSDTSLQFIIKYPHAEIIAGKRVDALTNTLCSVHQRHPAYYRRKAEKIKQAAKNSLPCVEHDSYITFEIQQQAKLISDLQKEINKLKGILVDLARTIDIFNNIVSITGIGEYTAALFLAEIKDPRRFSNVKKLTASCGLDPTIIQSGKSINYNGPISKRGNRLARKILFNIVVNIIRTSSVNKKYSSNPILNYYRKKRSEGKHHYASVIACTTKLLRIIYSLCMNNQFYSY